MIESLLFTALLAKAEPEAPRSPPIPPAIQVPAGARLARKLHGAGAQIYVCAAPPGGVAFAWTLKRPDARLFDATGAEVGTHGAGPNWTAKDGSVVVGEKIAQADAPIPGAVPWLLLRAKSTSGVGTFAAVTYIQRLETKGGKAPATGCDAKNAGTELRVDYGADYYFFEKLPAAQ